MRNKLILGRDRRGYLVVLEMEIKEKEAINYSTLEKETMKVLSISGYAQYRKNCDYSYCGQIYNEVEDNIKSFKLVPTKDIRRILEIWHEYHLNDMKAGTDKQVGYIKQLRAEEIIGKGWQYDHECCELKLAGLYEDRGIEWGHGWYCEPIPEEVIVEVNNLFKVEGK